MKLLRLTPVIVPLIVGVAGSVLAATPAMAAPPPNGCPAGYQLLSVQTLTAEGYKVPALVDSPTSGVNLFGHPGDGDGWVCGNQLANQLTRSACQSTTASTTSCPPQCDPAHASLDRSSPGRTPGSRRIPQRVAARGTNPGPA
jgi:hypothetical protein